MKITCHCLLHQNGGCLATQSTPPPAPLNPPMPYKSRYMHLSKFNQYLDRENSYLPGDPEYNVNGGTTVSGGRTVLSAMAQQSFSTLRRPLKTTW